MAKFVITFEDAPEGDVIFQYDVDPPIDENATDAQFAGALTVAFVMQQVLGVDNLEDVPDDSPEA